eukprot:CAMPEP_0170543766 /NCGR_PEP_ID=MMETSP0211-20121228/2771_1 /TAXON_ID=311385 /ORGANISM="Pseudokeronopsis sp., Strain OXSARD2" /LENGTH=50 /DNA_ID=CAMNT_0010847231 /DNA_START=84 /DNA_END=236 /DNA_ORIENTATION=-
MENLIYKKGKRLNKENDCHDQFSISTGKTSISPKKAVYKISPNSQNAKPV